MKFAAAVAALLAALAMPALAQHGVARGGFGGHAAGVSHGSFGGGFHGGLGAGFAPHSSGFPPRFNNSAAAFRGFAPRVGYAPRSGFASQRWAGSNRFAPGRFGSMARAPYRGYNYGAGRARSYSGNHSGRFRDHYRDHRHHFDHDRMPYGGFAGYSYLNSYAYPYGAYPIVLDPWLFGPDDWNDTQDTPAATNSGQSATAPGPSYDEGPQAPYPDNTPDPYPNYGSYAPEPQAAPSYSPRPSYTGVSAGSQAAPQQSVTVIFKNGRAPEKIQNYMLTASTLTVLDPHYQQISVDQIDLPATEAANRADGADFQVPPSGK